MKNQITWLGHAAFEIVTARGKRILIDPWITGNPACPVSVQELEEPDLVLISHDHHDHFGDDLPELFRGGGAILAAQPEILAKAQGEGVPEDLLCGMNVGGTLEIEGVKVTMTQAVHSAEKGTPAGFILTLEDGKVIYHAGDTGVFASMSLLGELYPLDLALLPIGGVYTMDALQAGLAVQLLQPKAVVPMHFKTFEALEQSAEKFEREVRRRAPEVEIRVLRPGEKTEI